MWRIRESSRAEERSDDGEHTSSEARIPAPQARIPRAKREYQRCRQGGLERSENSSAVGARAYLSHRAPARISATQARIPGVSAPQPEILWGRRKSAERSFERHKHQCSSSRRDNRRRHRREVLASPTNDGRVQLEQPDCAQEGGCMVGKPNPRPAGI